MNTTVDASKIKRNKNRLPDSYSFESFRVALGGYSLLLKNPRHAISDRAASVHCVSLRQFVQVLEHCRRNRYMNALESHKAYLKPPGMWSLCGDRVPLRPTAHTRTPATFPQSCINFSQKGA